MDEQGSSREDDNQSLALSYIVSSTQAKNCSCDRRGTTRTKESVVFCFRVSHLSRRRRIKGIPRGQVASVDIKLPRRSLQVEFSCNSCGERRTKRLINRLAYERGLVFVQCGGCLKHHKLVENLGHC